MAHLVPTPRLPQDLQTRVVGFLRESRADLIACASTAHSLLPAAQYHLFRDITVFHPRIDTDDPPSAEEDRDFARAAFRRLAEVLRKSPRLIPYIRVASIAVDFDVVVCLASVGFSRIDELELINDNNGLDGTLIEPLQRLVRLESLKRLSICGHFSPQIFHSCAHPFTVLTFDDATAINPDIVEWSSNIPHPIVAHLKVVDCTDVANWLVGLNCPFDFTSLYGINLSAEQLGQFDLAQFSALTDIDIVVPYICGIVDIIPPLANLTSLNSINTIGFNILEFRYHRQWAADLAGHMNELDAALVKLPLPALQQVTVTLPPADPPVNFSVAEPILRGALPVFGMRHVQHIQMG
ncbi:hypothetical protein C8R44DRAFT_876411 [Mycena epipterygia]|nr:hypothetical protein C8R44DRAFT_876411 [Mycena epipterygia]